MSAGRGLGRHLPPPVDDARIDRQWRGVVELRHKGRSLPLPALALAFAALVTVAGITAVVFRLGEPTAVQDAPPLVEPGTVVETATANVQPLRLGDGSRLEIARKSRVQIAEVSPSVVRLVLAHGSVTADVQKSATRVFSVNAGGYDVIVRGTRFQVALVDAPRPAVTVLVERGRVEVRPGGSTAPGRFLDAGEGWTEAVRDPAALASAPDATSAVVDTPPVAIEPSSPQDVAPGRATRGPGIRPEPAAAETPDKAEPDFAALVKERKYRDAFALLGEDGFAREVAGADARRLLELSDVARLSGHPRDAARALDRLRLTFRSDSRAGLAALELGRLRMDALGDRRGALAAFDDAVALSRAGAVREDAEARRVQVLEALGDLARCRTLRDAYLSSFPNGVHAPAMRARCTPK